ncbi:peptidoglycan recognition family protein [Asanoa sp. NPDC049573]|uniref:peptidoglycan recognition protein family protein n=1 Tax=Asanoa sp. NPDC049573 TaxID=3155396 RepID=UPI003439847F
MRVPGVPFVQGRNSFNDADGKHFGIAIHNTSNANLASAQDEADFATRRTDGISAHFYCDKDSVVQSLDTDARAGHAGSTEGNQNSIAVEITGLNSFSRQRWLDSVAWDKLASTLAFVIRTDPDYAGFSVRRASVAELRANPQIKAFYGHDDMRRAFGGTTHTDPGPNFPWDHLIAVVQAAVDGNTEEDDMFSDADRDALTSANFRALGVYQDLDEITYRKANGQNATEPNKAKVARQALERKVAELAARPQIDIDDLAEAIAKRINGH